MFISGLYFTTATITTLFSPAAIIATAVISVLVKHEKGSILKFIGIAIAVIGAIFTILALTLSKSSTSSSGFTFSLTGLIGSVCLILNVIAYGAFVNIQMHIMSKRGIPPLTVSSWSCLYGLIFTSITAIPFVPNCDFVNATWQAWYAVVYAGTFGASLSWTLNTAASKYTQPTMMAIHQTAMPVWTAILSYILLGEMIPWYAAGGAVLVVAGVVCVAIAKYKDAKNKKIAEIEANIIEGLSEFDDVEEKPEKV